jgi:hypothetical protein
MSAMSEQEAELKRQIVMHIHAEDELVKARRFIDALLAVAKAADNAPGRYEDPSAEVWIARMGDALKALYAAHPDWRDWATTGVPPR